MSDLQIWHGNMCVAQAEMYALNGVDEAEQVSVTDADTESDHSSGLLWVITIGVVLAAGFLLLRYRNRFKAKKKTKRTHQRRRNG